MSGLSAVKSALGALLCALGCGTVDTGSDFQFAEVVYDQNYFYCKVEPMLLQSKCGPGEDSDNGGCHFDISVFRLTAPENDTPVPCNGLVPQGLIPEASQLNYTAASNEMSPDPERANLLGRPTKKFAHPRKIFEENSPQAEIIRQWATQYTSR